MTLRLTWTNHRTYFQYVWCVLLLCYGCWLEIEEQSDPLAVTVPGVDMLNVFRGGTSLALFAARRARQDHYAIRGSPKNVITP